jgi:hypothetical protein
MTPIDQVLQRLDSPRPTGRDRWRVACPVCGGGNRSTLSVGVGDGGAVLLKCFKSGCGPDEIVGALGLELADLFPRQDGPGAGGASLRRRAMLSPRQAINLIEFECLLVWTAAFNLAHGYALTPDDLQRLHLAGQRIQATIDEVGA